MNKFMIILGAVIFSTVSLAKQSTESGFGVNYGGIAGVTINSELNSNTEIFGGIGLGKDSKLGYVLGAKFWLNEKARLSANYGTNCYVKTGNNHKEYEGLNFGIGYAFNNKESGWVFDLMFADISDCNDAASSNASDSSVKVAAGYRF